MKIPVFIAVVLFLFFSALNGVQSADPQVEQIKAPEIKTDAAPPVKPPQVEKSAPEKKLPEIDISNDPEIVNYSKWTLVQAGLFCPVQIYSKMYAVRGFRFNFIYTDNIIMDGLDISACGLSSSRYMNGLQLGIAGRAKEMNGVQILAFANGAKIINGMQFIVFDIPDKEIKSFRGFRVACIAIPSDIKEMNGFLISGILSFCEKMNGVQISYATIDENVNGVQIAASFNQAKTLNGVQFGIINYCDEFNGVQIGVLNFSPDNWLPISIGLNIGF